MTNLLTSHARIPGIMTIRTSDASLEGESDKTSAKSETRPALGHQSPRHVASRTHLDPDVRIIDQFPLPNIRDRASRRSDAEIGGGSG